jgi:hypothetical protein
MRRERAFERVEQDCSQPDLPIELERAGPHGRIANERDKKLRLARKY